MTLLMTQGLSDYFLSNAGIDSYIPITSDYTVAQRDSFSYRVERSITLLCFTLSHLKTSTPGFHTYKLKSDHFFTMHEYALHNRLVIYP